MKLKTIIPVFAGIQVLELVYLFVIFDTSSDGALYSLRTISIVFCLLSLIFSLITFVILQKIVLSSFESVDLYLRKLANDETSGFNLKNVPSSMVNNLEHIKAQYNSAKENEYKAKKSKDELVATLDSGIKAPINSIRDIAELLQMRIEPGKERSQIELICSKASRVQTLITEILSTVPENTQEVPINIECAQSMVLYDMINQVDYDKRVAFVGAIPKCDILIDVEKMENLLEGIISNSYKYANTQVTIHATLDEQLLNVTIRDYGNGVSPTELSKLFDKYYRGQNSVGRAGAGLGLYVALHYMEKMNGMITCENFSDGFGVTVSIRRKLDEAYGQMEF